MVFGSGLEAVRSPDQVHQSLWTTSLNANREPWWNVAISVWRAETAASDDMPTVNVDSAVPFAHGGGVAALTSTIELANPVELGGQDVGAVNCELSASYDTAVQDGLWEMAAPNRHHLLSRSGHRLAAAFVGG